jgi:S1-C subfamily serine protease
MKAKLYALALAALLSIPGAADPGRPDPRLLRNYIPMVMSGYQIGTGVGSGFVLAIRDNPDRVLNLVVTNAHVFEGTDTLVVTFVDHNGTENRYNDIRIVTVDEANDVAVLALMGGAPLERGFKISIRPPLDGDIAGTGGYPGASWAHESNVVVTNPRVRLSVNSRTLEFIRINSSIDNGSSGGPLLLPDGTELGFSVMGINTLGSKNGKQGFAIPIDRFIPVLEAALRKSVPGWEGENHGDQNSAELFKASVSGCFGDEGKTDWYKLRCPAGEFYLRSSSPEPLELSLSDESGRVLDRSSGSNPAVRTRLEKEGDIFIAARPGQTDYFQTYYLASSFAAYDPYEGDSAEAPLPLRDSRWLERSLYIGDEDWFETAALGPRMKIDCDASFAVFPAGDSGAGGSVYHGAAICDATTGDAYRIKILPGEAPKNYRLRVSFPQAEREPNNSREEAQKLERGLFVDARINGDDNDWYRIPAGGRTKVSIRVEGGVSFETYSGAAHSGGWIDAEQETTIELSASRDIFIHVTPRSVYQAAYTIGFDVY